MKKILKISLLLISIIMLLTITSNAFTVETSVDKNDIKVGEEIVYKVKLDEKVIAANFDIVCNSKSFELVESKTTGLNVSEKDGKVACIYVDMNQQGINEFEIKFKAIKNEKEATFSLENVKFRVAGQKDSYTLKDTKGLEKQSVKVTTTVMTRLMWLAVIGIGVIVMESIILLITNKLKNKKEIKKSTKVMSIILALFVFGTLASNVEATSTDMVINFSKIGEEKIVQIVLPKDDSDRQVTKEEIMAKNNTITSIKDENGNEIQNSAIVKTGYKLQTANGTSTVVILGDANKDGYVCDTDDIMVIIDDYLGKVEADTTAKTAANLYNEDDMLDTDDVMQMINMYLGKIDESLLSSPIESNTEDEIEANYLKIHLVDTNTKANIQGKQLKITQEEHLGNVLKEYTGTTDSNGEILTNIVVSGTQSEPTYIVVQDVETTLSLGVDTWFTKENNKKTLNYERLWAQSKLYVNTDVELSDMLELTYGEPEQTEDDNKENTEYLKVHIVNTTTGANASGRQFQITGSYAESNYDVLSNYTGTTDNNGILTTQIEVKGSQSAPMKIYIKDLTTSDTFTTYAWYEGVNDGKVLKNDESVVNTSNVIFLNTAITNSSMLELRLGASENEKEVIEGNLTIHLVNSLGSNRVGVTLKLTVGSQTYTGTTDSNGILQTGISISASKAEPVKIEIEKPNTLFVNVWFTKENNQKIVNAQTLIAQGNFGVNSSLNGTTTMLEIKY